MRDARMRELVGRPRSDGFGSVRPIASNSNAPTDSRHTFSGGGQSVDRTRHTNTRVVRSREEPRGAARIRERHTAAHATRTERRGGIVLKRGSDQIKTIDEKGTERRGRGGSGGFSIVAVVVVVGDRAKTK